MLEDTRALLLALSLFALAAAWVPCLDWLHRVVQRRRAAARRGDYPRES
jgi:hypothetical protein